MKKITIENFDGQTVIIANKIISMTDAILTYEPKREKRGAIAIDTSTKVTIEDCKEERDWLLVFGRFSEEIYAEYKGTFDDATQVKLQDFLTQSETEELAHKIEKAMNSYKF